MTRKIEHTTAYLKRALRATASRKVRESHGRFFREPVRALGVRVSDVRKLARAAAKEYRAASLPLADILGICDQLWRNGVLEERNLAFEIAAGFQRQFEPSDWKLFDDWVDSLSNWAETDGLSTRVLAPFLTRHRAFTTRLRSWTRRRNRWRQRAAAVALVPLTRRGEELEVAF